MTLEAFKEMVDSSDEPPAEWSSPLRALWCARRDRWHDAHDLVQDDGSSLGSWIHGHLHLIEGDLGNAGYWYSRAGKPAGTPDGIAEDWETIATVALAQS